MKRAFLGLDIGGTGAKAAVYDEEGTLLGMGRKSLDPHLHADGRVEIPIEKIKEAARRAVQEALHPCPIPPAAVSIVSQGQTFVPLDGKGQPLHPAILWYDSRAALEAEELNRQLACAQSPSPRFSAISSGAKIAWLFRTYPDRMRAAHRFLLLPDYFTWQMTGRPVTDPHTAGSTGFSLGGLDYHPAALAAAAIQKEQLAEIQPPGTVAGRLLSETAKEWGLPPDIPVIVGTNDQYAGALGAGVAEEGILAVATGTCLAAVTLKKGKVPPLPTGLFEGTFPIPGYSFVLAYTKTAGVALEWFRREFAPALSLAELDQEASQIPPGSHGILVCPHFDGKVSPSPIPEQRGVFAGLTLHHRRADLYRALLESLAYCLRENIAVLTSIGLPIRAIHSHGGGAASDFWLQMQADVTQFSVHRGRVTEAATLGAAMLAATGAGFFPGLKEAVQRMYRTARVFSPSLQTQTAYRQGFDRYLRLSNQSL